jgi:hypothetical protein
LDIHETGNPLAVEQGFSVGALERRDHGSILTNCVSNVKCYSTCPAPLSVTVVGMRLDNWFTEYVSCYS